jgi:hypothetical protein
LPVGLPLKVSSSASKHLSNLFFARRLAVSFNLVISFDKSIPVAGIYLKSALFLFITHQPPTFLPDASA